MKNVYAPPAAMMSAPKIALNIPEDPNKMLARMAVPDIYKSVMAPDIQELAQLHKRQVAKEQSEKARQKAQQLAAKSLAQSQPVPEKPAEPIEVQPKRVTADEAGRVRDEKGNILNLNAKNVPTSLINKTKQKEERLKEIMRQQKTVTKNSKIFDSSIINKALVKKEKKKLNAFHFGEKGDIIRKADAFRKKIGVQGEDRMEEEKKENGALVPAAKRQTLKAKYHDPVPDLEWWDIPFLIPGRKNYLPSEASTNNSTAENQIETVKNEAGSNVDNSQKNLELLEKVKIDSEYIRADRITNLIEHPVQFKNNLTGQNIVLPMYFTKDERKKLRRQKRQEREKEKQDKVRLGILPPPPPKLKLSNYMNIIGDDAVAEPTKAEMQVKSAVAARLQTHLERNEKKKLTKEQKADKVMRKLKRDSALECRVCIFRVENLWNRRKRFKVDKNAQQMAINGIAILADKKSGLNLPCVVVIEGGPKAVNFYKKLMLRRIKWDEEKKPRAEAMEIEKDVNGKKEEPVASNEPKNTCHLIWEGVVKDHNFNKWKMIEIKSELEGRRALAERGVEHYWDQALSGPAMAITL
jgi:U4/U6 small nuclear ribonucleoprotein PRP3